MSQYLPEGWTDAKIAEAECWQRGYHYWFQRGFYRECSHCGKRQRVIWG